jgi:NADH:ubiquinone oxidoreductase subunit C
MTFNKNFVIKINNIKLNYFYHIFLYFLIKIFKYKKQNVRYINNVIEIKISKKKLLFFINFLKNNTLSVFTQLTDIICYDIPGKIYRFSVKYILQTITYSNYLNILLKTNETEKIDTLNSIYKGCT